jgi:hypothetical protein
MAFVGFALLISMSFALNFSAHAMNCAGLVARSLRVGTPGSQDFASVHFAYGGENFNFPSEMIPSAQFISRDTRLTESEKIGFLANMHLMFHPEEPEDHAPVKDLVRANYNPNKFRAYYEAMNEKASSHPERAPADPRRISITTHQAELWQADTGHLLETDPELKQMRHLVLASDGHPIENAQFLRSADQIFPSMGGEVPPLSPQIEEVHLTGGFCNICMKKTVERTINQLASLPTDKPLEFFVYANESYYVSMSNIASAILTLHTSMAKLFDVANFNHNDEKFGKILGKDLDQDLLKEVEVLVPPYGIGRRIQIKSKTINHRPIYITVINK